MRKRSKDFITHRDLRISKFNSRKAVAPCMGEQEDYLAALEIAELKGLAVPSIIANALDECIEKHVSIINFIII